MRIRDWSSDVCSSDLLKIRIYYCFMTDEAPVKKKSPLIALVLSGFLPGLGQLYTGQPIKGVILLILYIAITVLGFEPFQTVFQAITSPETRSEARRVGKECFSTCRSRV